MAWIGNTAHELNIRQLSKRVVSDLYCLRLQCQTNPKMQPSETPSVSDLPSSGPSETPSVSTKPSSQPSMNPSVSHWPTSQPSESPSNSAEPSGQPWSQPSMQPSSGPSNQPNATLSEQPSPPAYNQYIQSAGPQRPHQCQVDQAVSRQKCRPCPTDHNCLTCRLE